MAPPRGKQSGVFKRYEKALKLLNQGKFAPAVKEFNAIVVTADVPADLKARAEMYRRLCERRSAKSPKPPKTAEEFYDLGVVAHNRGEYSEALKCYQKALKLTKDKADFVHLAIATTEAVQGNTEAALEELKKSIQLDEQNRFLAQNDPDFDVLRSEPAFRQLVYPDDTQGEAAD